MKNLSRLVWILFLTLVGSNFSVAAPKYRIAVIPKSNTGWWVKMKAGAQKAARELDAQIFWVGTTTEDEVQKQIKLVNTLGEKVDGLVIAPLDPDQLVIPIEQLLAKKKPVVIVDSILKSDRTISMLATDNLAAGTTAAHQMAEALNGRPNAKVAVFRFMKSIHTTEDRGRGFIEEAARLGKFKVVDEVYGDKTAVTALEAMQGLMKKHPDLDGIFSVNWPVFQSAYLAVKKAGKTDQIKLVGIDEPEQCLMGLRTGEVSAVIMQNPFNMGYLGVKAVVASLKGQPVEKNIDTGTVVATQKNIGSAEIQKFLNPKVD